ncbi:glycosyltransferase involved in cell wall biosynthesis [Humitalea rosea]|uniref:Glycosyltransferase involved in cell wall biosynthesis n=1 Tax=Humitalea rosea TaxID=990373 RepID=A0A2W7IG84_9PROT|nr:glycosyltransferase [Humitalea rosea]PZW45976.1 glycosyltransferase involved in cell wall biosynthesis [Humitalea rosea]
MRLVIDLQGAQGSSRARGIGRFSRELALAMAREPRGHECLIAISGAMMDTAEELVASFGTVVPHAQIKLWHPPRGTAALAASPLRPFAETLRAQFLASLRPDLVHVTSLFEGLGDDVLSLQPAELERLPVVATCYDLIPLIRHEAYFGPPGPISDGARWYYRCAQEMALSEGLLAISDSSRQEAIRHLPFAPERVFNIQAGISPTFRPAALTPDARAALLRRYGLQEEFILFLGAGDIRKNEAGLIAAYGRLPAALRQRHQLLIVGKMAPDALRKLASSLDIPFESFVIIPFVEEGDLTALYSTCALFVFPSLHEGFGLPVAEAMACGAPTIASNTTSLPEVIGRDDATFDPNDPDAIAACMRKVLENPAFRAELAAFGPGQAARFTWRSSAARAWDAMEAIHARREAHQALPRAAVLRPRPSLAFVSPLPPQNSGIADYSRELLPSLAYHYDITLVTETPIADTRLQAGFARLDPAQFLQESGRFDRVLYQLGNSSFHRFQIEDLLPNCPGMVVLHDAYLSNYVDWLAHERGRPDDFRIALLQSHGYPALRFDTEHGRQAALATYPCSLPVLQDSLGLIQHSHHGVDVLRRHFGAGAADGIAVIPHLRTDRDWPGRAEARAMLGLAEDAFVVCSFGVVTPLKCPGLLAEAWRRSGLVGRLVFVGDAPQELRQELADPEAGIQFTGRVGREAYDAWLACADLAVQWRLGSRGESSGAVADVLIAGVPLVCNRHGSAAELPEPVALGLPEEADAAALAMALTALRDDPARRAQLGAAGRAYALRDLAPDAIAARYRDAIEAAYSGLHPASVAQRMADQAQATVSEAGGLLAASRAIGRSFPQPWRAGGRPRLLIDMSELARRDHGTGIQRVVREIGRRVLEQQPGGWRGEAVRVEAGRLRRTHAVPLRLLDHAPLNIPETPLDAGEGDLLLCIDVNAELTEEEYAELRRLRLGGMRIVLVIYDLLPMRHPELFPEEVITLIRGWYTRMLTIADGALCISRAVADELLVWLDEDATRRATALPVGFFHLGADFTAPATGGPVSAEVQAALASAERRPTVVMTGTVEPRKGYAQSLSAFEALWAAGQDIGLTIIGKEGWQMEAFIARLRASPALGDRLHWVPKSSDAELRALYGAGAGLLMASNHEGFGLPIIEAALASLPVLARDLPVFREVAGENASYFSGTDAKPLADAVAAWMQAGFTPPSDGIRPLSWDESFDQLCAAVVEGRWYRIWRPGGDQASG